jgi:hypothetical protein
VYFRLMFGGELRQDFAERVVNGVLRGYASDEMRRRRRLV